MKHLRSSNIARSPPAIHPGHAVIPWDPALIDKISSLFNLNSILRELDIDLVLLSLKDIVPFVWLTLYSFMFPFDENMPCIRSASSPADQLKDMKVLIGQLAVHLGDEFSQFSRWIPAQAVVAVEENAIKSLIEVFCRLYSKRLGMHTHRQSYDNKARFRHVASELESNPRKLKGISEKTPIDGFGKIHKKLGGCRPRNSDEYDITTLKSSNSSFSHIDNPEKDGRNKLTLDQIQQKYAASFGPKMDKRRGSISDASDWLDYAQISPADLRTPQNGSPVVSTCHIEQRERAVQTSRMAHSPSTPNMEQCRQSDEPYGTSTHSSEETLRGSRRFSIPTPAEVKGAGDNDLSSSMEYSSPRHSRHPHVSKSVHSERGADVGVQGMKALEEALRYLAQWQAERQQRDIGISDHTNDQGPFKTPMTFRTNTRHETPPTPRRKEFVSSCVPKARPKRCLTRSNTDKIYNVSKTRVSNKRSATIDLENSPTDSAQTKKLRPEVFMGQSLPLSKDMYERMYKSLYQKLLMRLTPRARNVVNGSLKSKSQSAFSTPSRSHRHRRQSSRLSDYDEANDEMSIVIGSDSSSDHGSGLYRHRKMESISGSDISEERKLASVLNKLNSSMGQGGSHVRIARSHASNRNKVE